MKLVASALLTVLLACSSASPAEPTPSGGPVVGPADAHCGALAQVTSVYACPGGISGRSLAITVRPSHTPDAGLAAYGATMFGTQGGDDDCKYDLGWSADAVRRDADVIFTLNATARATHAPLTGARPSAEVYLDDTHPAPNSGQATTETAPGRFTIGPVRFDRPGRWTVRFHLFEQCADLTADSPHGHGAFFVDVP